MVDKTIQFKLVSYVSWVLDDICPSQLNYYENNIDFLIKTSDCVHEYNLSIGPDTLYAFRVDRPLRGGCYTLPVCSIPVYRNNWMVKAKNFIDVLRRDIYQECFMVSWG